jgi:glucans biosynthesis protein
VHVSQEAQAVVTDHLLEHAGGIGMQKQPNNSLQSMRLAQAPRCLARTRAGKECQSPAVSGKRRCRMHGGTNPGAPVGNRNAWKHGARSAGAIQAAHCLALLKRVLCQDD